MTVPLWFLLGALAVAAVVTVIGCVVAIRRHADEVAAERARHAYRARHVWAPPAFGIESRRIGPGDIRAERYDGPWPSRRPAASQETPALPSSVHEDGPAGGSG